jgi:hypothetical protein
MITRCPELESLARDLYAAVANADPAFFERRLSDVDGLIVIGTAPGEWWSDYGAALDAIRRQMKEVGTAIRLTPGDLRAWSAGDVGWVADRPTLHLGGREAACRHTSVFVRRDGDWRIVQHHFSMGVPDATAFGL